VDVNMQRLRKALSEAGYEAYIQTVRGFGYRFAVPATRTPPPGGEN
jgi:DNA-binding response OmpR family regulator